MTLPPPVLVVDDIPSLRAIYQVYLSDAGFPVIQARSGAEGLEMFRNSGARIVLLDMFLPDTDGLDLMREMLAIRPSTAIIVITADRSIDRAIAAIRSGAQDFLVKPVTQDRLIAAVRNAQAALRGPVLPGFDGPETPLGGFISLSPVMQTVYDRIRSAARSTAPILVWGEGGTGKRLCARTIHDLSPRARAPFVTVDCAAMPPQRFGLELLGAYDGDPSVDDETDPVGAVTRADRGTLFLNNIDRLAREAQPALLKFLERPTDCPVGNPGARPVDVRVIAAASTPPGDAPHGGLLGDEVFQRLQIVPIRMPPLRERREDIVPLAETLLRRYADMEGRGLHRIAPAAAMALRGADWPGNVRQLMNVIHAVTVLYDGDQLTPAMLPEMAQPGPPAPPDLSGFAGMTLAEIERLVIEAAVTRHDGSVPGAAAELDIAASTIYRKIGQWRHDTAEDP